MRRVAEKRDKPASFLIDKQTRCQRGRYTVDVYAWINSTEVKVEAPELLLLLHVHKVEREHSFRQMNQIISSFEDEEKQKAKMITEKIGNLKVSASDKDYLGRIKHFLFNHT